MERRKFIRNVCLAAATLALFPANILKAQMETFDVPMDSAIQLPRKLYGNKSSGCSGSYASGRPDGKIIAT